MLKSRPESQQPQHKQSQRKLLPTDRVQRKGATLEYAYVAGSPEAVSNVNHSGPRVPLTVYPLLGSLVRALGKGWRVLVVAPEQLQAQFQNLQQNLQRNLRPDSQRSDFHGPDLAQLKILSVEALAEAFSPIATGHRNFPTPNFDLVLSLYPDSQSNTVIRNHPQILGQSHVMTREIQPDAQEYDLISDFEHSQQSERLQKEQPQQGVLAITGTGKGKTTTALGLATAAAVQGGKAAVIQWFKEKKAGPLTWAINEHNFPVLLTVPDRLTFYPTGAGFVGSPQMDRVAAMAEHQRKAREGVALAKKLITSGEYTVVVLDEFVDTLQQVMTYLPYPLLEVAEVQELLELALTPNSQTQVIVTGRKITPEWERYVSEAILVTEKKHPWSSKHQGAVAGLDF